MIPNLLKYYNLLYFTLFQVIFILLAKNTNTILGFTNETDQQALFAVKDLMSGDPFNVLSSWNRSVHFCHWGGVTCSRRHQRVTVLDLSSLNLVGLLSPQIGNLTFLRTIYFQNNSFHGIIPQEIGQLYRLQHLLLHNNSFQGNFPSNLSRCLDIRRLFLYGNKLGGYIPNELGSLSNLIELDLSKNNFIGPITPSLGNLSSLIRLELSTNHLVGNIPSELSLLSKLKVLNLGENNLSGMVPLPLYNISSIQSFGLYVNKLQGKLPPNLGLTLPNLEGFFISVNKFSGPVPPSIANASGIVKIDMGLNNFTGPLPMNWGSLRNLDWLVLYGNQLGTNQPHELSFLIKSLINCSNLQSLNIGGNGFRGEFPHSIVNLSTMLTQLDLSSNYISGRIPKEIGNLFNLMEIVLNDNMLIGTIPKSFGKLSKLEGLYLQTNNISGEIPDSIGNISRLSILNLGSNILEGSIPVALGNLTNLQGLDLSNNSLTGVIPEQFVGLPSSIFALFLNQNELKGDLPSNMGSLKNLVELDISGNRLTGEIPSTLGDCVMLSFLYMRDNNFQGNIPSSFKQLTSVQILYLSYNNLSGQIPSFLGTLSSLYDLDLSHNKFVGEVPTKGVFSNTSNISIVGNSELCGGIKALQLPTCHKKDQEEKRKRSFPKKIIPLVVILPIVILLLCLAMILYLLGRSKEHKPSTSLLQDQYPKLSYADLRQGTNGFSLTNLIGEGRYASVYKGNHNLGEQIVAVKVLNVEVRGANTSFLAECEAYRNIRHRNLVKIITACSSTDFKGSDFKALVLEFMPNGSLDNWLHPSPSEQLNDNNLTLLQRLSIAIDVAAAIDYLHNHCHTRIVHCDLKPSNVLLDEEFHAHVSDFGLARFLSDTTSEINHSQTSSIGIRGTTGYVPPEYGMGGDVSPQGDVYSYGILLLELFTGKRPTSSMFMDSVSLCNYVMKALPQKLMEVVDLRITTESEDGSTRTRSSSTSCSSKMEVCLTSILQIGILCCVERPRERMDIKDVKIELSKVRDLFVGVTRERGEIENE